MNPAVSLAMVILGKLPLKKFPVYVLAQFLGAFAGSCAVYGLYYGGCKCHHYKRTVSERIIGYPDNLTEETKNHIKCEALTGERLSSYNPASCESSLDVI